MSWTVRGEWSCHPAEVTGECYIPPMGLSPWVPGALATAGGFPRRNPRTHLKLPGGVLAWRGRPFLPPALQPLEASGRGLSLRVAVSMSSGGCRAASITAQSTSRCICV